MSRWWFLIGVVFLIFALAIPASACSSCYPPPRGGCGWSITFYYDPGPYYQPSWGGSNSYYDYGGWGRNDTYYRSNTYSYSWRDNDYGRRYDRPYRDDNYRHPRYYRDDGWGGGHSRHHGHHYR